jgi:hypothetical protein
MRIKSLEPDFLKFTVFSGLQYRFIGKPYYSFLISNLRPYLRLSVREKPLKGLWGSAYSAAGQGM